MRRSVALAVAAAFLLVAVVTILMKLDGVL
jgi:hypothetical protein